jgi:hypothetical protein
MSTGFPYPYPNPIYRPAAELAKIRQQVEKSAKEELGRNKYRKKPLKVDYGEYEKLKAELAAKEKALAEMSQEYLILKKKVNLE